MGRREAPGVVHILRDCWALEWDERQRRLKLLGGERRELVGTVDVQHPEEADERRVAGPNCMHWFSIMGTLCKYSWVFIVSTFSDLS